MADLDPAERKRRLNLGLRRFHGAKHLPWLTALLSRHFVRPIESLHFLDLETTDALWERCRQALQEARSGERSALRLECRLVDADAMRTAFAALHRQAGDTSLRLFLDGIFDRVGALVAGGGELFAYPFALAHERGIETFTAITDDAECGVMFDYGPDEYFEGTHQAVYTLEVWGDEWVSAVGEATRTQ
jgi:hypothetical protein